MELVEEGLIPAAIRRSKLVKPDDMIREDWEKAIYKDLENPEPQFCWSNFLSGLLP